MTQFFLGLWRSFTGNGHDTRDTEPEEEDEDEEDDEEEENW